MAEYKAIIELIINTPTKVKNLKTKEVLDNDIKEGIERFCGSLHTTVNIVNSELIK